MAIPKEKVLYCEEKKPGLGMRGDPTPCWEVGKESTGGSLFYRDGGQTSAFYYSQPPNLFFSSCPPDLSTQWNVLDPSAHNGKHDVKTKSPAHHS